MSCSRHCAFFKASNGKWFMELAHEEYAGREDSTTYGPFDSEEGARIYLRRFSNPGGSWTDDSGESPVPTVSKNGEPVVNPRADRDLYRPRFGGYSGAFGRRF